MPPNPLFSIIIPTFNRVRHLRTAVESIVNQDFAPGNFEVLVIDSSSTDGTREMILDMQPDHAGLVYLNEDRRGLSSARNCGWQHANGVYAAYTDDDCRLPSDWLRKASHIAAQFSPDAFGGPIRSYYESPKPAWWRDHYRNIKPLPEARMLAAGEYLSGGNLFVRRSTLESLGGFSPAFGHAGPKLSYGDETDLLFRLRSSSPTAAIYYDPDLYVYHLVHADKMTLSWAIKFNFASGRSFRAFHREVPEKTPGRILQLVLQAFRAFGILAVRGVQTPFRDKSRYPLWQNYVYEVVLRRFVNLGRIVEQLVG